MSEATSQAFGFEVGEFRFVTVKGYTRKRAEITLRATKGSTVEALQERFAKELARYLGDRYCEVSLRQEGDELVIAFGTYNKPRIRSKLCVASPELLAALIQDGSL